MPTQQMCVVRYSPEYPDALPEADNRTDETDSNMPDKRAYLLALKYP